VCYLCTILVLVHDRIITRRIEDFDWSCHKVEIGELIQVVEKKRKKERRDEKKRNRLKRKN